MKKIVLFSFLAISVGSAYSQNVSINDSGAAADPSAALDVSSTSKGLLAPRMTTTERTAIVSPAVGLLVYDTVLKGFYYYDGSAWMASSGGSSENYWKLGAGTGDKKSLVHDNSFSQKVIIGDSSVNYKPTAHLNVMGIPLKNTSGTTQKNALFLGVGQGGGNTGDSQILFGYEGQGRIQHAIKTRHNSSGSDAGNAMEFYLFTKANVPTDKPPIKNTLSINGLGRVSVNNINSTGTVATAPHSNLQVNGSFAAAVIRATSTLILTEQHYFVICAEGSSITLPIASSAYSAGAISTNVSTPEDIATGFSASGRIYMLSNITGSSINISSYTLPDGSTSTSIPAGSNLQLISDGTVWRKIN